MGQGMKASVRPTDCPLCRGIYQPGTTTVTVDFGSGVIVIRGVPATVRKQCGADWLSDATAERVESVVEGARARHAEVEVLAYS